MKGPICDRTGRNCFGETELLLLFEISRRINNTIFVKDVLNPIMEMIASYLGAERSYISILNRKKQRIFIEASYGITYEIQQLGSYLIGEGITGEVVKTGKPVYISKLNNAAGFVNKTQISLKNKDNTDKSFICVPIHVDKDVLGTLSITIAYNPQLNSEEIIRLLMVIGSLIAQAVRARQDKIEEIERLKEENKQLQIELKDQFASHNIIGNSAKIKEVFKLITQVAKTQATVLIRGESGVGKELVADAIHYGSKQLNKPFIKVNCSALPESLIESELFGHEKGAFTGAENQKKGRFELAHNGTIFLDEIGDLPANIQVKLLRVIQEKQFERLGGVTTINTNVRIIAATNRNLEEAIINNSFREDLYYRLNVFPIFIPPLRERISEIPILVDHFIEKCNKKNGTRVLRISSSALEMMMIYSWPGNIRELENCIERATLLSDDQVIRSHNLPPSLQTALSSNTEVTGRLDLVLEKIEKQILIDALTGSKGNIFKSAKDLGISNRKMGLRIEKYGIDVNKYKL